MSRLIGLVAFSFALRADSEEPNPCNVRLAEAVERIVDRELDEVLIVAQWEVAKRLEEDGWTAQLVVNRPDDGTYLDSEGVWDKARELFADEGVSEVILVAQPFLQLTKIKMMVQKSGYTMVNRKIGWIGFDSSPLNSQWWTKGPVRSFLYALRQLLIGSRGH